MNEVLALVDYDNVKSVRAEQNESDVEANLIEIARFLYSTDPTLEVLWNIRLYGGWIDEKGSYTTRGQWLLNSLASIRTRFGRHRMVPSLALRLAAHPTYQLIGTFRSGPASQKMVDSMICLDLTHYAAGVLPVIVLSDDDDIVPSLIVSGAAAPSIRLARIRVGVSRPNDPYLLKLGFRISAML